MAARYIIKDRIELPPDKLLFFSSKEKEKKYKLKHKELINGKRNLFTT